MIDAALAASAVAMLTPYVARGGEALAEKLGEEVGSRLAQLWDAVKAKLGAAGAAKDVANFEGAPEDEDNQAGLRKELKKVLADDPAFQETLSALVAEIATKGGDRIKQVLNVTGDQNTVVQIGKGSGNIVNM